MNTQDHKQALPPGFRLGNYRVVRVLGAGGFGVTYLCEHGGLGVTVAVKEYLPNDIAVRSGNAVAPKSTADREGYRWGLGRFLDEARTLARFEHRNVVRVRDYFEANGTAYIVMDYEDGEPLDRVLERKGTLTEAQIKRVLLPIVAGLRQVHAAGFLHRDVKPANIFIRRSDESPVLLDFGSARQALSSRSRSVTAIASAGYSPPEQYESDGEQGPWTDIYALSALCYRAITGVAPAEATRRQSRLLRGEEDPLPRLAEIARGRCSQAFLAAVDRGLRVVEGERQGSLDEWWAELESRAIGQATSHLVLPTSRSGRKMVQQDPRPVAEGPPKPKRRFRAAWVLSSVMMAVTVVAFLYFATFEENATFGESAEQGPDAKSWFMQALDRYLLCAAAGLGDADAQFDLGTMYEDDQQAVLWYRKAAEQGHAVAQYHLGTMYDRGEGVDEDYQQAVLWYRKAAEQGVPRAQYMLSTGERWRPYWYRIAAEQGHADAQFELGVIYDSGKGVAEDHSLAVLWYRKAAEQGHAGAQNNLGVSYQSGEGVAKDARQAVLWFRKAAEQGNALAQANLGTMYKSGEGVAQDARQAVLWFRKAAEQGHAGAQDHLGTMYYVGEGVAKDVHQAVLWYRKAAEQGHAVAQVTLGWLFALGEGVAEDDGQAVCWFRVAAEQGEAMAQFSLGWMYARGEGVPEDPVQAYAWYNLAAAQGDEEASEKKASLNWLNRNQIAAAQRLSRELAAEIAGREESGPVLCGHH